MAKFKSTTGSPVHIFRPGNPNVIEVGPDEPYETDDEDELQALRDSPETAEVRGKRKAD